MNRDNIKLKINRNLNTPIYKIITNNYFMKCDILENEYNKFIFIDLPGCSKEQIKISLENNYLIVYAGRRREKNDNKIIINERFFGTFYRSFYVESLQEKNITAKYLNGVLEIELSNQKYVN